MAVNPFDDSLPTDTSFVGEPITGAQAELRGIKNILKFWNPATGATAAAAFLAIKNIFTQAQVVTPTVVTWAATINLDGSTSNSFRVTLAGTTIIAVPTNMSEGQQILLLLKQDAVGSRTYTFNAAFKFSGAFAPVATATANASDIVAIWFVGGVLYAAQTPDLR